MPDHLSDLHIVHAADHVGVALRPLVKGEQVSGVTLRSDVPKGHKVTLHAAKVGDGVRKYGWPIGVATQAIEPGSTVLLFTTGRGTPLGFPAPTLKIASNRDLAQRKPNWIDFDAGVVLRGASMQDAADGLMDLIIATASGMETRAERNGEREIAIWKIGVTL